MNIDRLIGTMCEIVGERHNIKVTPHIRDKKGIFANKGAQQDEKNFV